MITQWLINNILLILSTLFGSGSFIALILEKNKRKIEEKQLGADALTKMQEGYDKFTTNALEQYDNLRAEVMDLKKKLANVTAQLEDEEGKYNTLKLSYEKLKISYDKLKKEFDSYRLKKINQLYS